MNLKADPINQSWFTYIVECNDGTYYTGSAKNLTHRIDTHNMGKGAKYTRGRRPVTLVYYELCPSRSRAVSRENEIKRLNRKQKIQLIAGCQN